MEKFAVFILSYGRAGRVTTIDALRNSGYSGKIYIVIDNTDDEIELYKKMYDNVIVFDKLEIMKKTDYMNNNKNTKSVVYARNYSYELAKDLGLKYFVEIDDDVKKFHYRFIEDNKLKSKDVASMDRVIDSMLGYLEHDSVTMLGFGGGSHYIGGVNNVDVQKGYKRNAFGVLFLKTDSPVNFRGLMNEDMNANIQESKSGNIVLTTLGVMISSPKAEEQKGGQSDIYKEGKYIRDFYNIMFAPDSRMNDRNGKITINVLSNNLYPKLLGEDIKKVKK